MGSNNWTIELPGVFLGRSQKGFSSSGVCVPYGVM